MDKIAEREKMKDSEIAKMRKTFINNAFMEM